MYKERKVEIKCGQVATVLFKDVIWLSFHQVSFNDEGSQRNRIRGTKLLISVQLTNTDILTNLMGIIKFLVISIVNFFCFLNSLKK